MRRTAEGSERLNKSSRRAGSRRPEGAVRVYSGLISESWPSETERNAECGRCKGTRVKSLSKTWKSRGSARLSQSRQDGETREEDMQAFGSFARQKVTERKNKVGKKGIENGEPYASAWRDGQLAFTHIEGNNRALLFRLVFRRVGSMVLVAVQREGNKSVIFRRRARASRSSQ